MTENQKHYLINLVKHDLELLEEMAADDPQNWEKTRDTARGALTSLCGGEI